MTEVLGRQKQGRLDSKDWNTSNESGLDFESNASASSSSPPPSSSPSWFSLKPWPLHPRPEALVEVNVNESIGPLEWLFGIKEQIKEKPCVRDYAVKFKLSNMHSYFTVPTCEPRRSGAMIRPELKECGRCDTGNDGGAEIHWNIPDCTERLCVWPKRSVGEAETIGPPEGLKIHPKCAWNIINQLKTVYKVPWRAASLGGVFRALGGEAWNPINWGKVVGAGITGGFMNLAKKAAETVQWKKKLDLDCENARSLETILQKNPIQIDEKTGARTVVPIGAVCWNNIIDFHDLWCHWKERIDINDEAQCDQIG
eukprot:CAMPEP_0169109984 /NCGR_PEP_ID=MMETSP1015-20121227/26257_1 /TAXON_ID=342587 /ORGANISM="Karlodinium micrum, Strain CCMP2283" /LENGTH=311 /DNA_ID=CAMNT_0009171719 /DNA_START=115 /DNA_END=1050 /DNA_ORIENTATION=-